ncbi:hypothetical protein HELRODRAFT_67615 [Helobdella robusta]|uniref:Uncharacterized protein n=1 Tax=Helobdella robusta TaxID=6412 RepID=T1FZ29_HELRO|nr:hypothetical protein HELRODRAFT_67615 [Helobdella robusta]ESN96229.1 hypothetical protein HELRODRAFT_67615 [Helobdella robusta]
MGLLFSKLYNLFSTLPQARILMVGLDAAGKTTILYKIKLNETVSTIPTIGFNVETVCPMKGVQFTVWDVGGQEKIRRLWKHYYQNTDGLIFVVDSSDVCRMEEAKEELMNILEDDAMKHVPVQIIANKQDLPGALKPYEIVERLSLNKLLTSNQWHVQGACAPQGEGLYEALDSMGSMVKQSRKRQF